MMRKRSEAVKLRGQITGAAEKLSDEEAIEAVWMYDKWKPGVEYKKDIRIRYGDKLYRVQNDHKSQAQYPPSLDTASLYAIVGSPNLGDKDNPIPHEIGMLLEYGKYYREDDKLYFCYREGGSGNVPTTASLVYYAAFVQEVT